MEPITGISPSEMSHLTELLETGREIVWYNSAAWSHKRAEVLRFDHYECQRCRARGRYRKAALVHHVKHLRDRPDLALSIFDPDTGERQLVSVCRACHEELHQEAMRPFTPRKKPLTAERWD